MKQYLFKTGLSVMTLVFLFQAEYAQSQALKVVTSLSSFADITQQIAGNKAEVSYIVPPKFNPHFLEAKPTHVLKLKRADLFFHTGLDLEAWVGPLLDAVGRPELRAGGDRQVDLSIGIQLKNIPDRNITRAEGDIHFFGNPHYWIHPENGRIIATTITTKLCEVLNADCDYFKENLSKFNLSVSKIESETKSKYSELLGKEFIAYHDEWVYLADFLGIKIQKFIELKPGIPPSPKSLEALVNYIKIHSVKGLIQSTFYPLEAANYLNKKTEIKVLLLCQNVAEKSECSDYQKMIAYNINQIGATL
ncbi:MAG: metal ABC transporter substrate-binding protein [bacterium]|nr:metal ABC transporter substrate-binding protein [bacterium]